MDLIADLQRFLDASPCPAFAADTLVADLRAAGFQPLDPAAADWGLAPGRYVLRRGEAVVAFALRRGKPRRYLLVGAHVDSPHLRLKPRPAYANEGCLQLGVEVYGGALHNSWLDRDLGLAGTVHTADGARRVRIDRPLARVPQLAIHLDRKVNEEGVKLNAQTQLPPLWGLAAGGADPARAFAELLASAAGVRPDAILAHDLSLFDVTPAARLGAQGELLASGRLDNLASCHAGMRALIEAADGEDDALPVLACFDHEEVGSESLGGAGSPLLEHTLLRIADACGMSRGEHFAALAGGLMLSADMAHAAHPNYADRHDPRHKPRLGEGPVLKTNANQRYATDAAGAARVRGLAKGAGVALQDFVARTDLGCGSTIGPTTAANLGLSVVDLGAPMLSMHSARELSAVADHAPYVRLLAAHLRG